MDANDIAGFVGYTLPLGIAVYIGSYVGVFKRQETKLPGGELVGLFFFLWLLSAVLLVVFSALLSGVVQDSMPESVYLVGPLIVGIIVGRKIVKRRRDRRANANQDATNEDTQ